jgi:WXG100 family type VII secretion target
MAQGAGGSFRTELPVMQTAANHVYEVNQSIQGQLSTLLARLEPLTSTWQGAASVSFQVLATAHRRPRRCARRGRGPR